MRKKSVKKMSTMHVIAIVDIFLKKDYSTIRHSRYTNGNARFHCTTCRSLFRGKTDSIERLFHHNKGISPYGYNAHKASFF